MNIIISHRSIVHSNKSQMSPSVQTSKPKATDSVTLLNGVRDLPWQQWTQSMWQIELSSWPPVAAGPPCFPIRGTYQNSRPSNVRRWVKSIGQGDIMQLGKYKIKAKIRNGLPEEGKYIGRVLELYWFEWSRKAPRKDRTQLLWNISPNDLF